MLYKNIRNAEISRNREGVNMGAGVLKKFSQNNVLTCKSTEKQEWQDCKEVLRSWRSNAFNFIEEDKGSGIDGLRRAQIGGVYAALGHVMSDVDSAGTIIMPTGTGKTETILSIVVSGGFERTLVVVPSQALREQTKEKFVELGLLRELSLIDDSFLNPNVLTINQSKLGDEGFRLVEESNVIISTPSSLSRLSADEFTRLRDECSHLIVDEAHHVKASTWLKVREKFLSRSILQFTATPFRADGKRVDGKILYHYSIKSAQDDGLFKNIAFHPVKEFVEDKVDNKIAGKAIELLRQDIDAGYDHVLMARTESKKRAREVYECYKDCYDLNPVLIYSGMKSRNDILKRIRAGEHKIIVCVDMLGEGFDLPQLKVAALHDIHKGINITLQFAGRFTRGKEGLGDAKFVANIANVEVDNALQELYNEDSDWNYVIQNVGHGKIRKEIEFQRFLDQFNKDVSGLIELGLYPKISTTVYELLPDEPWTPGDFSKYETPVRRVADYSISKDGDVLAFSVQSLLPVRWTKSHEIRDTQWDLYIAYYDRELNLLFIHSSGSDSDVSKIQRLIAKRARKISGENVFRVLSGVKRLYFQNVGLNRDRQDLRYIMYTGTDTKEAIPEIQSQRARKSNIFAKGFSDGRKVTVGCSYRGKIWAMESGSIDDWIDWCKKSGKKLLDKNINPNEIMRTAIQSEVIQEFPDISAINIDWPNELLRKSEDNVFISVDGAEYSLMYCELNIVEKRRGDKNVFKFVLTHPDGCEDVEVKLDKDTFKFFHTNDLRILISGQSERLKDYFTDYPPMIFYADTSVVEGKFRYYSNEDYLVPFDKDKVTPWKWEDVDISLESQREDKLENSIQYYTVQSIKDDYDFVFDDDGSGEIADIVAIKNIDNDYLVIDFYHCKYCGKVDGQAKPGARVDDVYQVAGQATKCVKWMRSSDKLFDRLQSRELKRIQSGKSSRIDKGDLSILQTLRNISRLAITKYNVYIVQPAISKEKTTRELLSVIGAAEAYIHETSGASLAVYSSE